jgi:L-2,4-diaminobutyrate decarboxylase
VDLAQAVARCIDTDPAFERVAPVAINSVVFRCTGAGWGAARADQVNSVVRQRLLHSGRALVGRTRVDGRCCLKFTLLNPATTLDEVQALLADIRRLAQEVA